MAGDDDLKALLPEPPPPAPKRREAAIAEALARFDGTPAPQVRLRAEKASWWKMLQRPQAGLLATAALVAAISLPFAWTTLDPGAPAADEQLSPPLREDAPATARDTAEVAAPSPATTLSSGKDDSAAVAPTPRSAPPVPAAKRVETAQIDIIAPAEKTREPEALVVSAQRASRPALEAPSAISAISSGDLAEDSVVVTGTRISPRSPPKRGDWNACTVNDPSQTLSRCRKLANKGTREARAKVDTDLADGLKQAWEGDLDGAIAAFDRAIAVAPDLSIAYLNRGLAYERQGDGTRAMADLDRAVQYAPQSARAYYNRSIILRKNGDARRADLDEKRAINLDSRYQAIPR